jgi:ubiquinone/menaquinone biosynthesis C-methylase UbiE
MKHQIIRIGGGTLEEKSRYRAHMPEGTNKIINSRTLQSSHKRLAEMVRKGMSVLDVGCGSGAITRGICELVGDEGNVVGTDINVRLIEEAKSCYMHSPGLRFEIEDIYRLPYHNEFNVVTASRVLQWLAHPEKALLQMIVASKEGGMIIVLDYNHEKIQWEPSPPKSMLHFYSKFLEWRADAGMENTIADQLEHLFKKNGMSSVKVTPQLETVSRGEDTFESVIGIWTDVAASRGHQMVEDGIISEEERALAEAEYSQWIKEEAKSQTLYLLAVEGVKTNEQSSILRYNL